MGIGPIWVGLCGPVLLCSDGAGHSGHRWRAGHGAKVRRKNDHHNRKNACKVFSFVLS